MTFVKKLMSGVMAGTLMISSIIIPAGAEKNISVILNGNEINFDVPPQIINERTMVPLRAIFEALGAEVDWNSDTKTVTSEKDGTTIKLTIDNPTMYINDKAVTLDAPGCIIDGRTLVPVRAISEAYDAVVEWDSNRRIVNIKSEAMINASFMQSNSEFEKFKNQLMEKGSYDNAKERYYLARKSYYNHVYWYSPIDNEILVLVKDENDGIERDVSLSLKPNTNPHIIYGEKRSGKDYIYSCDCVNNELVKYVSDFPSQVEPHLPGLITLYLSMAELELKSIQFDISFESFGVPKAKDE